MIESEQSKVKQGDDSRFGEANSNMSYLAVRTSIDFGYRPIGVVIRCISKQILFLESAKF